MDDFLHVLLLGIVSKQTAQPLSVLVELEDLLLRAIHVHNVDRAVERLEVFVSLVLPSVK